MYNKNNIFYKIIQKEISTSILYENKFFICIKDINPQSAIHFLIISKNNYRYFSDLTNSQEQLSLFDFIQYICNKENIEKYTLITNNIRNQEIYHFHIHLLA